MSVFRVTVVCLFAGLSVANAANSSQRKLAHPPASLSVLDSRAHARLSATPRMELAPPTADLIETNDNLEPVESGHIPNYVRALAVRPGASRTFTHLFKAVLYDGSVEPEVKMAMGLRIAQISSSPYVAAHVERLLSSSDRGQALLSSLRSGHLESLKPAEVAGVNYADWLSPAGYDVSDKDFQELRAHFDDSQIVELTLTVSFFNYFTRLAEALKLPVESWLFDSQAQPPKTSYERSLSRVHVITDGELDLTGPEDPAVKQMRTQSSLHIANTERAMLWSPEIAHAWWAYGKSVRESAAVEREVLLQVSFAVSTANGCHY